MSVAFPYPVGVRTCIPRLKGMRYAPFTNIDGETFAAPSLNGYWELELELTAVCQQQQLALSAFVTQMSAPTATCTVPLSVWWRPNDSAGRMMQPNAAAPEYTFDHVGWDGAPFDGFTLRAAVAHRDSYIDINKPALSQLWPGHYITLDDRLYQVVKVSALAESETAIRVSVMPNIRGSHASGKVVVVDQLALKCKMEQGDQIGASADILRASSITLIEAF